MWHLGCGALAGDATAARLLEAELAATHSICVAEHKWVACFSTLGDWSSRDDYNKMTFQQPQHLRTKGTPHAGANDTCLLWVECGEHRPALGGCAEQGQAVHRGCLVGECNGRSDGSCGKPPQACHRHARPPQLERRW